MHTAQEERFIRQAFQALIDRGIAKPEYFSPSTVSDEDIIAFERKFNVILPALIKTYLKAYCYDFNYIRTPVPIDINPITIQSKEYETHALWLDLLSVPKENPLKDLYHRMENFREMVTDEYLAGMTIESISHLLPIADWYAGAGPLCIDLRVKAQAVDLNRCETWSLHFFDHEEFDWKTNYTNANGMACGHKVVPDFQTLLEWYFYERFDRAYELDEGQKPDLTFIRL